MLCTMIVHVDDLLATCKDEGIIAGVIEGLKTKYYDVQEHMRVKQSYLGMPIGMSEVGMCSITIPIFIAAV